VFRAIKQQIMAGGVNLAYYNKRDWKRFLALVDDKDSMHDTWKEWNKAYLKTKKGLIKEGFLVREIIVNLDELKNYCLMRGIKIDGNARSQFVAKK
jgi:hypothetical protein